MRNSPFVIIQMITSHFAHRFGNSYRIRSIAVCINTWKSLEEKCPINENGSEHRTSDPKNKEALGLGIPAINVWEQEGNAYYRGRYEEKIVHEDRRVNVVVV